MEQNLYVFSGCFYIIKAKEWIPKRLLKEIDGLNFFLLIDSVERDIYLINPAVHFLLQEFRRPNSVRNVVENIENGILPDGDINRFVKDFFKQLIHRKILILASDQPEIFTPEKVSFTDYEVLEVLRRNKKTVTVIAKDKKEDKPVIIKCLMDNSGNPNPKEIRYYQRELEIMEKIGSHRLIRELLLYDRDKNFAVLEFIKGRPLDELIKIGKLKMKHKLYLVYQIIESLSVIHEKKIAHGDIHAGQFLVALNLSVKLIDFGLSIVCSEESDKSGMNIWIKGGAIHYFEPENISDNVFDRVVDYIPNFRMDIYRTGVLLYFLIYEKFPFENISWKRFCKMVVNNEFVIDSHIKGEEIPVFICDIIKKSMNKKPEMRYKSATEILTYFKKEYDKFVLKRECIM
jgi:serine/threonine protein kinase